MNYLAFDLGASSGRVILGRWDGERLTLNDVHRFDHAALPLGGGLYWDFPGIYREMNRGIQKAAACTDNNIFSLGIDTFANDFSLISEKGELLIPMRCYRDGRTAEHRPAIFSRLSPRRLYQLTGNQISLFSTLMQLAAMQEAGQGYILEGAHKLLFLPDLLGYYITGAAAAEYTISSVSQMYDYCAAGWSRDVLAAYNIPERLPGPLVPPGTIIGDTTGNYRQHWGVGSFKVTAVCAHDTASAFLACPGGGDGVIISSGTWSLVGAEVDQPIISDLGFEHNIANEGGYPGHHRLIRNVMGLWLLQELRAGYLRQGLEYSFDHLSRLAAQARPFAATIDVDDELFYAPGDLKGRIQKKCAGQSGAGPETPGELTRCIYESLALKYRWAVEKLEQLTGRSLPVISIVGGGARERLLCQFTANVCARPVIAGPSEASALGNLMVQCIASGELGGVEQGREIIKSTFPPDLYEPQDIEMWEEQYQRFLFRTFPESQS